MKSKNNRLLVAFAVWAGSWQLLYLISYFVGLLVAVVSKASGEVTPFSLAAVPVFPSALVALMACRFWRAFSWGAIVSFLCFDIVSRAIGAWYRYEQYADLASSGGRRGGLIVAPGDDLWLSFAEPLLWNAAGYLLIAVFALTIFKSWTQAWHRNDSDRAAFDENHQQRRGPNPVVAVFCAFAGLSTLSGWLMSVGRSALDHYDVAVPFGGAHYGLLYWMAIALLFSGVWFFIGGRIFRKNVDAVSWRNTLTASVAFSSSSLVAGVAPYVIMHSGNLPFPWLAILNGLGVAILQILTHALAFWLGQRRGPVRPSSSNSDPLLNSQEDH